MSWRRARALTLLLLVLLIAAPLSSGDKGLWLSLTSTPVQHLQIVGGSLPAEHGIVLPDDASRTAVTASASRPERTDAAASLPAAPGLLAGLRRTFLDVAVLDSPGEPFAVFPAPRAPPA